MSVRASEAPEVIGERAHSEVWARVATERALATGALAIVLLNLERISSALAGGVSIQGIGRDLARVMTSRPQAPARGTAAGGGQIQGASQRPALPPAPSSGGTVDAYQRGVQEHIRLSSTQGS